VEILLHAEGERVKAAAQAALKGDAADVHEFLATGVYQAADQDLKDLLAKIDQQDKEERARLTRLASMRSAAAVLGIVASDGMLAMTDTNFIVAIWNAATEGTEVHAAAVQAVRSSDADVQRAFIDTGIHDANRRDIKIALDKKAATDRRLAQDVLTRAERAPDRNLALAARTALAGSDTDVADFLRVGQHQVRPDLPDVLQVAHSGMCLSITDGSTAQSALSQQYPCTPGRKGQSWHLLPQTDGAVEVRNANSGMCLGIGSSSKDRGARPLQWRCNGNKDQHWIPQLGHGGLTQLKNVNSGLCLAVASAATEAGAKVIQWTCNGGLDQAWHVRSRGLADIESGRFNRDEYDDLIGVDVPSGRLMLYPGTATGGTWGAPTVIGTGGWNAMSKLTVGRFNRDAYDDLIAVHVASGKLYLYPGTAAGGAFGTRVEIGAGGWNGMGNLVAGNFNRDEFDDLVAVQVSTGKQFLYPGTADGGAFGGRTEIGTGWNGWDKLVAGNVNRDEFDDLVAVQVSTGKQFLYPGTAKGFSFGARVEIGNGGWNGMSELTIGRFDRDGHDDLVTVQNATGKMFLYRGTPSGGSFAPRHEIGIGG
ncbi:MAG TPA: RICIN domain-containing protein, partial [Actinoplanes sp.]|nr:RICIN domain-containing protein [Actinoplanes sp.]